MEAKKIVAVVGAIDVVLLVVIPHFIWHQTMPHSTKLKRGTA